MLKLGRGGGGEEREREREREREKERERGAVLSSQHAGFCHHFTTLFTHNRIFSKFAREFVWCVCVCGKGGWGVRVCVCVCARVCVNVHSV